MENGAPSREKLLVTGASGLLGANLAIVSSESMRVFGTYHAHPVTPPGITMSRVDLGDEAAVDGLLQRVAPKWVVHCAAATNVDACETEPEMAFRTNASSAGYVARAAREVGARLLFISTDSVFDGRRGGYVETDEPAPINIYARSKLAGEHAVAAADPDALIVRTSLYGWNAQPKQSLSEWILARLEAGEEVPGFTDACFNALLANDLCDILIALLPLRRAGVLHVGAADGCSKYEFARRIARQFGLEESLVRPSVMANGRFRAARPSDTRLDCSTLARLIPESMRTMDQGVARFKSLRDEGFPSRLRSLRPRAECQR